jgi:hypothetical protein
VLDELSRLRADRFCVALSPNKLVAAVLWRASSSMLGGANQVIGYRATQLGTRAPGHNTCGSRQSRELDLRRARVRLVESLRPGVNPSSYAATAAPACNGRHLRR